MNPMSRARAQTGFSLVELLLALALGLVVVTGIVQLFVGNSRTYEVLTGQARMQENARFALEFISQAARSAGHFGCSLERESYVNGIGGSTPTNEWQNVPPEFDVSRMVMAAAAGEVTFRGTRRPGFRLAQVQQPSDDPIVITTPNGLDGLQAQDVVVLSNCEQGAVFRVTGVNSLGSEAQLFHMPAGSCDGNTNPVPGGNTRCIWAPAGDLVDYSLSKLNRAYGIESRIGVLQTTRFFVNDGALWQQVNGGVPDELVAGVDALEILFGLDTADDGEVRVGQYVPWQPGIDYPRVVAIRINVTVNSIDAEADGGGLMRRTFGKTIQLRNTNPEA
jgi:type IV pilus assembly protein PilW